MEALWWGAAVWVPRVMVTVAALLCIGAVTFFPLPRWIQRRVAQAPSPGSQPGGPNSRSPASPSPGTM